MTNITDNWKKTFSLIWTGQVASLLTTSAVNFAVTIFLTFKYESAEVLAYSAIAALLPTAILWPFAGVFIDRWNKKYTMMLADAFVALCTVVMAVGLLYGVENLVFIYIMLALRAVGSAFHFPAMQASMPLLAPKEEFMRISGMSQGIQSISFIAWPALWWALVGLFPNNLGAILMFDVVGAAIAIIFLSFVKFPVHIASDAANTAKQVLFEMKEWALTILSIPAVKWVFTYSILIVFALMPVISLLPLMAKTHFQWGVDVLAYVEMSYPIGMMIGWILLAVWKPKLHALVIASISLLVLGTGLIVSKFLPSSMVAVFLVLLVIMWIINTIEHAAMNAFNQMKIPPEKMWRVMSLSFSISTIPSIFGLFAIGFLTDVVGGVANVFMISGIILCAVGVVQYLTPAIQRAIKEDTEK